MTHENESSRSGAERAVRWVGDLDHPFFDDERQRFIWYEASTIAFQLLLVLQAFVGCITLLVMGRSGLSYFYFLWAPTVVAGAIMSWYSRAHGAEYFPRLTDLNRSRGVLGVAMTLLLVVAFVRLAFDGSDGSGFNDSWIAGAFGAVVGPALYSIYGKRKQQRKEEQAADLEI